MEGEALKRILKFLCGFIEKVRVLSFCFYPRCWSRPCGCGATRPKRASLDAVHTHKSSEGRPCQSGHGTLRTGTQVVGKQTVPVLSTPIFGRQCRQCWHLPPLVEMGSFSGPLPCRPGNLVFGVLCPHFGLSAPPFLAAFTPGPARRLTEDS